MAIPTSMAARAMWLHTQPRRLTHRHRSGSRTRSFSLHSRQLRRQPLLLLLASAIFIATTSSTANAAVVALDTLIIHFVLEYINLISEAPHQMTSVLNDLLSNNAISLEASNRDFVLQLLHSHSKSYTTTTTMLQQDKTTNPRAAASSAADVSPQNEYHIYYGLEDGLFLGYGPQLASGWYKEPGNVYPVTTASDQSNSSHPSLQQTLFWDMCVDEHTGDYLNCDLSPHSSNSGSDSIPEYVVACDEHSTQSACNNLHQNLSPDGYVPCPDAKSQMDCSNYPIGSQQTNCYIEQKWCKPYAIVQHNPTVNTTDGTANSQTLGYVPTSTHCVNRLGQFTQAYGKVIQYDAIARTILDGNDCTFGNGNPVHGNFQYSKNGQGSMLSGPYAHCRDQDDATNATCSSTYVGYQRSSYYDPRLRLWYKQARDAQKEGWTEPYTFVNVSLGPTSLPTLGMTYSIPLYRADEDIPEHNIGDRRKLQSYVSPSVSSASQRSFFYGVLAVDTPLDKISQKLQILVRSGLSLEERTTSPSNLAVIITEATPPYNLIATSIPNIPLLITTLGNEAGTAKPQRVNMEQIEQQIASHQMNSDGELDFKWISILAQSHAATEDELSKMADDSISVDGDSAVNTILTQAQDVYHIKARSTNATTSWNWRIMTVSQVKTDANSPTTILPGEPLYNSLIVLSILAFLGTLVLSVLVHFYPKWRIESQDNPTSVWKRTSHGTNSTNDTHPPALPIARATTTTIATDTDTAMVLNDATRGLPSDTSPTPTNTRSRTTSSNNNDTGNSSSSRSSTKQSDQPFTSTFLVACTIFTLVPLTLLFDNTNSACMGRDWILWMMISIVLSPLLAEVYCMYRMVTCARTTTVPVKYTNFQAALLMIPVPLIQAIILTFITIFHPRTTTIQWNDDNDMYVLSCTYASQYGSDDSQNAELLIAVGESLWIILLLCTGCFLACRIRSVDSTLLAARSLEICFGNWLVTVIVVGPIYCFTTGVNEQGHKFILALSVLWVAVTSVAIYTMPRLLETCGWSRLPPRGGSVLGRSKRRDIPVSSADLSSVQEGELRYPYLAAQNYSANPIVSPEQRSSIGGDSYSAQNASKFMGSHAENGVGSGDGRDTDAVSSLLIRSVSSGSMAENPINAAPHTRKEPHERTTVTDIHNPARVDQITRISREFSGLHQVEEESAEVSVQMSDLSDYAALSKEMHTVYGFKHQGQIPEHHGPRGMSYPRQHSIHSAEHHSSWSHLQQRGVQSGDPHELLSSLQTRIEYVEPSKMLQSLQGYHNSGEPSCWSQYASHERNSMEPHERSQYQQWEPHQVQARKSGPEDLKDDVVPSVEPHHWSRHNQGGRNSVQSFKMPRSSRGPRKRCSWSEYTKGYQSSIQTHGNPQHQHRDLQDDGANGSGPATRHQLADSNSGEPHLVPKHNNDRNGLESHRMPQSSQGNLDSGMPSSWSQYSGDVGDAAEPHNTLQYKQRAIPHGGADLKWSQYQQDDLNSCEPHGTNMKPRQMPQPSQGNLDSGMPNSWSQYKNDAGDALEPHDAPQYKQRAIPHGEIDAKWSKYPQDDLHSERPHNASRTSVKPHSMPQSSQGDLDSGMPRSWSQYNGDAGDAAESHDTLQYRQRILQHNAAHMSGITQHQQDGLNSGEHHGSQYNSDIRNSEESHKVPQSLQRNVDTGEPHSWSQYKRDTGDFKRPSDMPQYHQEDLQHGEASAVRSQYHHEDLPSDEPRRRPQGNNGHVTSVESHSIPRLLQGNMDSGEPHSWSQYKANAGDFVESHDGVHDVKSEHQRDRFQPKSHDRDTLEPHERSQYQQQDLQHGEAGESGFRYIQEQDDPPDPRQIPHHQSEEVQTRHPQQLHYMSATDPIVGRSMGEVNYVDVNPYHLEIQQQMEDERHDTSFQFEQSRYVGGLDDVSHMSSDEGLGSSVGGPWIEEVANSEARVVQDQLQREEANWLLRNAFNP